MGKSIVIMVVIALSDLSGCASMGGWGDSNYQSQSDQTFRNWQSWQHNNDTFRDNSINDGHMSR